jgi:hypothetical protein
MKKTGCVFFSLVVLLFSCASAVPIKPSVENISNPILNETVTKNIGEVLLTQGTIATYDAVELVVDEDKGRIPKGVYIATRTAQGATIYQSRSGEVNLNRGMAQNFLAMKDGKLYFGGWGAWGNMVLTKEIPSTSFREIKATTESENNFQQTLIYTGKEQDIIKMSYREFSGNIARPAFTVDVTYNLNESDIIAFRSARFKIISASNTSITYVVLSSFN